MKWIKVQTTTMASDQVLASAIQRVQSDTLGNLLVRTSDQGEWLLVHESARENVKAFMGVMVALDLGDKA
jgi:hypothetical protein